MAHDPRNDPELPDCSDEDPKIYDVVTGPNVWVSVWAGEGQLSGVKINNQPPTESAGVFTMELGAAAVVKGTFIKIDAEVAKSNAATANGSLTIAAYQLQGGNIPINHKRWCRNWVFDANVKLIAESIDAQ